MEFKLTEEVTKASQGPFYHKKLGFGEIWAPQAGVVFRPAWVVSSSGYTFTAN